MRDPASEEVEGEVTDQEIVRLVAEKVMGWEHIRTCAWGQEFLKDGHSHLFDPLTSDADACAVVDRVAGKFYQVEIASEADTYRGQFWSCEVFVLGKEGKDCVGNKCCDGLSGESRRRAICLAALKTVGVKLAQ